MNIGFYISSGHKGTILSVANKISIIKEFVAAVSAGIIKSQPFLDLDYEEDSSAEVDANFIICESGKIAEIQATGEEYSFSNEQFQQIFNMSKKGIAKIIQKQKEVLGLDSEWINFFFT